MNRRAIFLMPFLAVSAHAHSSKVGDIKIGHAWALPTEMTIDGQVFMPLFNTGKTPDSLIAARSPVAGVIELRSNNRYDDPPAKEFSLEPAMPLAMRPTAYHLRLVGLLKPLKHGEKFSIVLDFLNAGEIELEVHVETKPGT
jgi:periplasmic copper chaperone A